MTFMTMHHIIYFGGQFGGLIRHWYQSRGQLSIEEIGGFDLSHWSHMVGIRHIYVPSTTMVNYNLVGGSV